MKMTVLLPILLFCAAATAQIPIGDFFELQKIGTEAAYPLNGNYVLTADITTQNLPFMPIGSSLAPFTGTFDGKGFTVRDLSISPSATAGHVGMFGYVGKQGTVTNLNVRGNVSGGYNVGLLAGTNHGTISNCYSGGTVTAARQQGNAGGLVGSNSGTISRSWSNATVRGTENAGGLVGILSDGTVTQSYAQGPVGTAGTSKYVGGLIGYVFGGTLYHCYATGAVAGTEHTGGLIGYDFGSERMGWSSAGQSANGSVQKAVVTACFWDRTSTGQLTSSGNTGEGKPTNDMSRRDMYTSAGWDFSETAGAWVISGGYPSIRRPEIDGPNVRMFTFNYSAGENGGLDVGDGTSFEVEVQEGLAGPRVGAVPNEGYRFARWSDGVMPRTRVDTARVDINVTALFEVNEHDDIPNTAILIYTFEDLCKIGVEEGWPLDGHYVVMNDIDASASRGMDGGAGFRPIGRNEANPFTGTFDGRGYTISGLYINRPTANNVGFFGVVELGEIEGINIVVDTIIGRGCIGGLAGFIRRGTITNCNVKGYVCGKTEAIGGLVGLSDNGLFTDCFFYGNIDGNIDGFHNGAGGLIGAIHNCTLIRCYSVANVSGLFGVGGLIGTGYGSIKQCFAIGCVSASGNEFGIVGAGGLIGRFLTSGGRVEESYSMVRVIPNNMTEYNEYSVGGLIGFCYDDVSVTNSFWDITTSTQPPRPTDWGTGLPTADLQQQSTYVGWDFTVWAMEPHLNGGYPFLRSLGVPDPYIPPQSAPPSPEHQISKRSVTTTPASAKPRVSVTAGKTLTLSNVAENATAQIRIVNLRGKTVARFNSYGNGRFSLVRVPSGRYIVEVRDTKNNRINTSSIILR